MVWLVFKERILLPLQLATHSKQRKAGFRRGRHCAFACLVGYGRRLHALDNEKGVLHLGFDQHFDIAGARGMSDLPIIGWIHGMRNVQNGY